MIDREITLNLLHRIFSLITNLMYKKQIKHENMRRLSFFNLWIMVVMS
jgi:hypothetical protein